MSLRLDYERYQRRRKRRAAASNQRLDIQGLRMVAVLTVFANHLWGVPHGGFIGVDVFFVISGFLITGNLLRSAEKTGTVSFRQFYWNRVRRIVPAATVVLLLTVAAAYLVFLPFRAREVGIDATWALVFLSNWWFSYQQTDYFRAAVDIVSPIQHYWSLSIEEQFYFVWPALIFVISAVVLRKAWTHHHRMLGAAAVMAGIVALSLGWALFESMTDPAAAYFNTFARVWELGVGALLACSVGALARIPTAIRPALSWAGLACIAVSLFLISDGSAGFPAPWALLPVAGAALVVAAGVGGEPDYQAFLRHPISGYIGDISYSLYLVHWPVIVILASLMDPGLGFSACVVALAFSLAIASYHFVENPLRRADWAKARSGVKAVLSRRYETQKSSQYAAVGALVLLAVAAVIYVQRPQAFEAPAAPPAIAVAETVDPSVPEYGPETTALQGQIVEALKATEWPPLNPSMESALISDTGVPTDFTGCGTIRVDPTDTQRCTWGDPSATTQVVVVGDSIARAYGFALRELALQSGGTVQVHLAAVGGCQFTEAEIVNDDAAVSNACPELKQRIVDFINTTKPDVVMIANLYSKNKPLVGGGTMMSGDWADSMRRIIEKFRASIGQVVLLSAPPADKNIQECYGQRASLPANCISQVNEAWRFNADEERDVAEVIGAAWIDSRPWFCAEQTYCPSFIGSTPVKSDLFHITFSYGQKLHPVMRESFQAAKVF